MTPNQLVNELAYRNYRHNRELSPNITPERWNAVYGDATAKMEGWYQCERIARVLKGIQKHRTRGGTA